MKGLFLVVVPSPFGPALDCTDATHGEHHTLEVAINCASKRAQEGLEAEIWTDSRMIGFFPATRKEG